jgi:hypothetical protein
MNKTKFVVSCQFWHSMHGQTGKYRQKEGWNILAMYNTFNTLHAPMGYCLWLPFWLEDKRSAKIRGFYRGTVIATRPWISLSYSLASLVFFFLIRFGKEILSRVHLQFNYFEIWHIFVLYWLYYLCILSYLFSPGTLVFFLPSALLAEGRRLMNYLTYANADEL